MVGQGTGNSLLAPGGSVPGWEGGLVGPDPFLLLMMVFTTCLTTLDPQVSFQAGLLSPAGGSAETWAPAQPSFPALLCTRAGLSLPYARWPVRVW